MIHESKEREDQMKKLLMAIILIILMMLITTSSVFAKSRTYHPAQNYLTFSWFLRPASLGLKHHLFKNVYATGNMDYQSSINDLEFQVGAVYMFPIKIIIFKLYSGGGVQLSRNEGYQYPYATVGTNFWFLFSDVVYPLDSGRSNKYRFGLSIKF